MYNVKYLTKKAPKLDNSGERQNIAKHGIGIQEIIDRLAEYEEAEKHGQITSVVKCRECYFRALDGADVPVCTGAMAYSHTPDDWFCAAGKPKDGGQDERDKPLYYMIDPFSTEAGHTVTHWMPLPPAPETPKEDE